MSEHIVHTAILEDSFSLVDYSDEILPEFKDFISRYRTFGSLGCITISGDQFSFRLLEECKALWKIRRPEDYVEQKLAFVLGWVSHRATDRQMKPIWTEPKPMGKGYDADPALSPTECSIYHEGFMFREYYAGDVNFRNAILPDELGHLEITRALKTAEFFPLVQTLVLRNLFTEQTIVKNAQDYNLWFEKIGLRRQRFYVDLGRYVRSAIYPEQGKLDEFVNQINFYDRNDAILQVAKRIRGGEKPDAAEISAAVAADPASHYGKALKLAYGYIKAASDYYSSDMPFEELKERLDIGKKGRDGNTV